ncbi:MAG: polysaccharide pyruvyl transferase family protein [Actinomycetota bacterium]|nr:polysaccharide pyruvyl transferase family protein [Actinomycetota bacterium]
MSVLLLNEATSTNLGDQAIARCLAALCATAGVRAQTLPFAAPPNPPSGRADEPRSAVEPTVERPGWREAASGTSPARIARWARWAAGPGRPTLTASPDETPSAVLIGGGELVSDNDCFPPAWAAWTARARWRWRVPFAVVGVGVTSDISAPARRLLTGLRHASYVSVRDERSRDALASVLGIDADVNADLAFTIADVVEPAPGDDIDLLVCPASHHLVLRRHNRAPMTYDDYVAAHVDRIDALAAPGDSVVLAYTHPADAAVSLAIHRALGPSRSELVHVSDLTGLCDLTSRCRAVLSGRMHALILAMAYGARAHAVAVSPKLATFGSEYADADHARDLAAEARRSVTRALRAVGAGPPERATTTPG